MHGFPAGLTGVSYMATAIVIQWLGLESGGDLNLLECLRMTSFLQCKCFSASLHGVCLHRTSHQDSLCGLSSSRVVRLLTW